MPTTGHAGEIYILKMLVDKLLLKYGLPPALQMIC